ncbi:MAG: MFS transporter [Deltaproteobacteria bacterium]|nr:MAG: MFS transporter [Deltaproteobacteria bacterium]
MIKSLGFYRASLLLSLYITQFIGIAFFMEAFVAILRKNGVGLEHLGLIYTLGLVWVVRFLWAPLIDRFRLSSKSHFKAWVGFFQTLMVLTLLAASTLDVTENVAIIVLFNGIFVVFSASQDVALDALVLKEISLQNRPHAMGLKAAGSSIGIVLGGGLGLVVYDYLGWVYTMLLLCVITLNSLVQLYFYREKQTHIHTTRVEFKAYVNFWKTRGNWLIFLFFYPATISAAFALVSPILVDLGWELAKIGFYIHIVGYSAGALTSLAASSVMKKLNFRRVLVFATLGQSMGLLLYLLPLYFTLGELQITAIVSLVFSLYSISNIAITTLMMDECKDLSPATGFAMQHGVFMFFCILFSSLSMGLAGRFGYENSIVFFSLFGVVAACMVMRLTIERDDGRSEFEGQLLS